MGQNRQVAAGVRRRRLAVCASICLLAAAAAGPETSSAYSRNNTFIDSKGRKCVMTTFTRPTQLGTFAWNYAYGIRMVCDPPLCINGFGNLKFQNARGQYEGPQPGYSFGGYSHAFESSASVDSTDFPETVRSLAWFKMSTYDGAAWVLIPYGECTSLGTNTVTCQIITPGSIGDRFF